MSKYSRKISFVLILTLLVTMLAPASYAEAAAEPYLAYQTTEYGAAVNKLPTATEKEAYRVEKLLMSPGDKVDVCFIISHKWKNSKWTSSDTNVATVNGKGLITAKNPGVSEITLTYQKKSNNKKVTVKTKVYVGEEAWDVSIGTLSDIRLPDEYLIKEGSKIDLQVYGIPEIDSSNYEITWKSSNKKVAEMSGKTLLSGNVGTAQVSVKIKNKATGKIIEKKINVRVTNQSVIIPDAWDNQYYKVHGQKYLDLFTTESIYLNNEIFFRATDSYLSAGQRVLDDHKNEDWLSSFMYSLDNGKDVLIHEVLAQFGWSKSFQEKMRFEAIQNLMKDICNDRNTLDSMVNEVQDKFEVLDTVYSLKTEVTEDVFKEKYIKSIAKASSIPEEQVKKLVNDASKKGSTVMKAVGDGIEVFDFLTAVVQLYCLEQSMIDCLMEKVDPASDMYQDLKLLPENKADNAYRYIKDTLLSEGCVKIISKGLSKIAENGLHISELSTVLAEVGVSVLVNHVYQGALADEIIQTTYLYSYANTLKTTLMDMQLDFMNQNAVVTAEDIEQYEIVFSAYLSALKTLALSAVKMDVKNSNIPDLIENSKEFWSYDAYIEVCMKNMPRVQNKMDDLLNKLGVKDGKTTYFTVNQKACASSRYSSHGCINCNVGTIINTSWFKNKFGTISTSQFPSHDVNASRRDHAGQSCFGFACFAQWYVYANSNTDKVTAERVATVKYNKADLQANVKPGDVLRVNGHSILVYAVEENGLRVIDSNWNMGGQLNCVVQKHLIPYNNTSCAGYTVYVNRVMKVEGTSSETEVVDVAKGQVGYLDLSKVGWSAYNVGTDVEMNASKAYTIYQGSKLKILGTYVNSKGNKIYHVYSESLRMNCYVSAKYVSLEDAPVVTQKPKVTVAPTPTVTPKPTVTQKPTVTPKPTVTQKPTVTPTPSVTKTYGYLDLSTLGWSAYNVGTDVEMNASKAYTIYQGSKFEILGKYTNSKGNQIYHVYSESLGMKCYVSAKVVALGDAPKKVYGTLDLKSVGWTAYNAGLDKDMNADKAYTLYDGAQLEILGTYTSSKGNKIYHVYSPDLKMKCYVAARFVKVK